MNDSIHVLQDIQLLHHDKRCPYEVEVIHMTIGTRLRVVDGNFNAVDFNAVFFFTQDDAFGIPAPVTATSTRALLWVYRLVSQR